MSDTCAADTADPASATGSRATGPTGASEAEKQAVFGTAGTASPANATGSRAAGPTGPAEARQ